MRISGKGRIAQALRPLGGIGILLVSLALLSFFFQKSSLLFEIWVCLVKIGIEEMRVRRRKVL